MARRSSAVNAPDDRHLIAGERGSDGHGAGSCAYGGSWAVVSLITFSLWKSFC